MPQVRHSAANVEVEVVRCRKCLKRDGACVRHTSQCRPARHLARLRDRRAGAEFVGLVSQVASAAQWATLVNHARRQGCQKPKGRQTGQARPWCTRGPQGSQSPKPAEAAGNGASLKELMKATGWLAHSVRGYLSGTVSKRMKLKLVSAKSEDGERRYSVVQR